MSKVTRGGHNELSTGAAALLVEVTEDRKVCGAVIKYEKLAGETIIDGTPGPCDQYTDLNYGTTKANQAGVSMYIPIHFNNAYAAYVGALGSELYINPNNPVAVATGTRILNNLTNLGFKNRGLKNGLHLHDIRESNPTAILVEVCFCEATEDVRIYNAVGADRVGKAIAEGIEGHNINPPVINNPFPNVPLTSVNNSIAQLQTILNSLGAHLVVDGFFGPCTLAACPALKYGVNGEVTRWLQKRLALTLQDGLFGNGTKTAVENFQRACHLSVDGAVGPNTWTMLLK
jgi:N-acetylmuramoyl-L-alanine amidase